MILLKIGDWSRVIFSIFPPFGKPLLFLSSPAETILLGGGQPGGRGNPAAT